MIDQKNMLLLANHLKANHYQFTTTTPASHAIVMQRSYDENTVSMRDIFGWNRPFRSSALDNTSLAYMRAANVLSEYTETNNHQQDSIDYTGLPNNTGLLKSTVRFSSLAIHATEHLFLHSAFPTTAADAVFFGPDSYRFATLLKKTIANLPNKDYKIIVDIGTGSGVGGIVAASYLQNRYQQLILSDINQQALEYAEINAALASIKHVSVVQSDLYAAFKHPIDLIIANPPYLVDTTARAYRHGGGEYGSLLSTRIVLEGLPLLAEGGAFILYTASPIVDGVDIFKTSIKPALNDANFSYVYEEIDPDVFGEELLTQAYKDVDRIAVVALVIVKK